MRPLQEGPPRFLQLTEALTKAAILDGIKANAKGLDWPLIAEVPTEGWPLLVDRCFQFSELATL